MPVKIRLSRQGKKGYPFYHIVVADSRAPRDGRNIERLGSYNPNTNPATVELDFDKALDWLQKGAQPTDTTRSILSKQGVMIKKHLLEGAKKGAFSAEVAEQKFEAWMKDKESKIQAEKDRIANAKDSDLKNRLAAETKVREARAQAIAKRLAEQSAAAAAAAAPAPEPAAEENNEAPAAE
jgi:small subunit ribosomal protein S16